MQFDLFENSRDVIQRNEAIDAARGRKAAALDSAIAALGDECTQDPLLPPLYKLLLCLNIEFAPTLSCAQALDDHADFAWFPAWALIVAPRRAWRNLVLTPRPSARPGRCSVCFLSNAKACTQS